MKETKETKEQDLIEEQVVVITDEDGKEYYYFEEEVLQVGDKKFAVLVSVEVECDCQQGCECEEDEAIIARVEKDENGEDVYCNPTDDEYDEVLKLYEQSDKDEQ